MYNLMSKIIHQRRFDCWWTTGNEGNRNGKIANAQSVTKRKEYVNLSSKSLWRKLWTVLIHCCGIEKKRPGLPMPGFHLILISVFSINYFACVNGIRAEKLHFNTPEVKYRIFLWNILWAGRTTKFQYFSTGMWELYASVTRRPTEGIEHNLPQ